MENERIERPALSLQTTRSTDWANSPNVYKTIINLISPFIYIAKLFYAKYCILYCIIFCSTFFQLLSVAREKWIENHSKCHHIWCNFLSLISIFCHSFIGLLYYERVGVRNGVGGGRGICMAQRNAGCVTPSLYIQSIELLLFAIYIVQ